jgi:hypothetical protein
MVTSGAALLIIIIAFLTGGYSIYISSSVLPVTYSAAAALSVVLFRLTGRYDSIPETDYLQSGESYAAMAALLLFSSITGYGAVSAALSFLFLWLMQSIIRNLIPSDSGSIIFTGFYLIIIFFFPIFIFGISTDDIIAIASGGSDFTLKSPPYYIPVLILFIIIFLRLKPELLLVSQKGGYHRLTGTNRLYFDILTGFSRALSVFSALISGGIAGSFSYFLLKKLHLNLPLIGLVIFIITQTFYILIKTGAPALLITIITGLISYILYFYTSYTKRTFRW